MTTDHPGYPRTPGIAAAVSRLTSAIDAQTRRTEKCAGEEAQRETQQRLGQAVLALLKEKRAAIAMMSAELGTLFATIGE